MIQEQQTGFFEELSQRNLKPLWLVLSSIFTPEPTTPVQPCLWRWEDVRKYCLHAAEIVSAEQAERRVLMLVNPGLNGEPAITQTLYAGVQIILPGEIARSHRHSAAALRFIIEGSGGYTSVDGEETIMEEGDFIITPNWTWHDHGNRSDKPIIWLDGLDLPLTMRLNQIFYQPYEQERFPVTFPTDSSADAFGFGILPRAQSWDKPFSPIINYKWERAWRALKAAEQRGLISEFDDVIIEYKNPVTGGPALPTMAAYLQLLRPGVTTRAHRHTSSTVYLVVRGEGITEINGVPFEWREHDIFCIPTWAEHRHINRSREEAVLFSFSDEPVVRSLGFYREQPS